jgi:hypothetical protein
LENGFSANQAEGAPVHTDLAKKNNANLYLSRLAETGAHVIAPNIRSKEWQDIERETDKFLADMVKL